MTLSGGEPLLYRSLRPLLAHAGAVGMRTAVVTNGMLLDARRLDMLHGVTGLIAISLDGVPASHNLMRDSHRAFETMQARLEGLRESGLPFGFIFTLTQHNLHELEWVIEFAIREGARLLQIHPLEEAGRADVELVGKRPDKIEMAYAYLVAHQARERVGKQLNIQIDVFNKGVVQAHPDLVFATDAQADADQPLSEIVSPLVVETDATVVPLEYGFPRAYAFGNLTEQRLSILASRWRSHHLPAFHRLCRDVHAEVIQDSHPQFFNWFEVIDHSAHARVALASSETP